MAAHADAHGTHVHAHHPAHQHHFETMEQQAEASTLGMWLFLVTEVMFFGGLFMAYLLYRVWYPQAWSEGSLELDIVLGGINTVVLIGSSLTMALAVRAAQTGQQRATIVFLLLTMAARPDVPRHQVLRVQAQVRAGSRPGAELPLRRTRRAAGRDLPLAVLRADRPARAAHDHRLRHHERDPVDGAARTGSHPQWYTPVEMAGLYWHFVDIVWIFLFPLLYLVDRAHQFGVERHVRTRFARRAPTTRSSAR